MRVTHQYEQALLSRTVSLELDETERFEVAVKRVRDDPQRMMVLGVRLTWQQVGTAEPTFHTKWSVEARTIRKDGKLGAGKSLGDWRMDEPELVTRLLADLAPEWFQ